MFNEKMNALVMFRLFSQKRELPFKVQLGSFSLTINDKTHG